MRLPCRRRWAATALQKRNSGLLPRWRKQPEQHGLCRQRYARGIKQNRSSMGLVDNKGAAIASDSACRQPMRLEARELRAKSVKTLAK